MTFSGIPADAFAFYAELEADNSKSFWAANKHRYDAAINAPITALIQALAPEFGTPRVFRPYRDVRFSADKTPYKDQQAAVAGTGKGAAFYVQIGSDGLTTGGGFLHGSPDQVSRWRTCVDHDIYGPELEQIVADLTAAGFEIGGEKLATRPRGVAADHPRLDLLRYKSVIGWQEREPASWMSGPGALAKIRADWVSIRPLVDWIGTHVGSPDDPAAQRGRR